MEVLPKLIVFDLDFTLWPFRTDTCRRPFQIDSLGNVKDLNGNLYKLYPDILNILLALVNKHYTLGLASRIEDISAAYQLLIYFNISHFFTFKEIYSCEKTVHFKWLNMKSRIPFDQMVFFDDDKRNIHSIAKLGVNTYHLKNNKGISFDIICQSNIKL